MRVRNVHVRELAAPPAAVGALIDGLASDDDRLWPRERWPAMRLDRPLAAGATGGHGPVRYSVESYVPGAAVCFRFTAPRGFCGTHRFEVDARRGGGSLLRHVLEMSAVGPARLTWPLIFRPLHDALLEDALDRAAGALGEAPRGRSWPLSVRVLRRAVAAWRRLRAA